MKTYTKPDPLTINKIKYLQKATTTLLLALSVVSTSKQFFGDPISCDVVSYLIYTGLPTEHKTTKTTLWNLLSFPCNR